MICFHLSSPFCTTDTSIFWKARCVVHLKCVPILYGVLLKGNRFPATVLTSRYMEQNLWHSEAVRFFLGIFFTFWRERRTTYCLYMSIRYVLSNSRSLLEHTVTQKWFLVTARKITFAFGTVVGCFSIGCRADLNGSNAACEEYCWKLHVLQRVLLFNLLWDRSIAKSAGIGLLQEWSWFRKI